MSETLVSVPPNLAAWVRSKLRDGESVLPWADYVGSDPIGTRLGSGGGTVSLLHSAWREQAAGIPVSHWLRSSQRLVLHAGGESRRLPAYASVGKALLPLPFPLPGKPARFDQTLSDFQCEVYNQVLMEAGAHASLLVASGDVWLDLDPLCIPRITSDVVGIGMRVPPEVAQHFGVFFVAKRGAVSAASDAKEQRIAFFLQKPSPREIYRHLAKYDFYVDTGLWLFSASGVEFLFRRCGWDNVRQEFRGAGFPSYLDMYTEIGSALGTEAKTPPELVRHGWNSLAASVVPLEDARFFHVGSSRQLLESAEELAGVARERPRVFSAATPRPTVTNRANLPVWVDATGAESRWALDGLNVVSGCTAASTTLCLRQEQCLEIVPVGRRDYAIRPYLLDDRLRGTVGEGGTVCGIDAAIWLHARGLPSTAGDVFNLPIYPIVRANQVNQALIDWFFAIEPDPQLSAQVRSAERLSAAVIPDRVNFDRYFAQRAMGHTAVLLQQFEACRAHGDERVFQQDLGAVAAHAARHPLLREWLMTHHRELAAQVLRPEYRSRLFMTLAELTRGKQRGEFQRRAQAQLQEGVLASDQFPRSRPTLELKEDQIVWARSPVRLDLAGGWTDTPPYCLEHGGAVLNVAVLLNRQPPIQVFIRRTAEPQLRLRSIDLGSGEVITTYAQLATFRDPRSGFSLPKAALAMAGFLPEFGEGSAPSTLKRQLEQFGGGLEISLLSAVPKGSGLGTSSILAATILAALNRACSLGWDEVSLYNRVLGVEQLLTTGGGWQDQAGALFRGVKLVQTTPGSAQTPSVRYLPDHLFGPNYANRTLLLYYTGITRLAKGILKEIVQDMFLARFETLQTLSAIRANAHALFSAVQKNDVGTFNRCIARSWELNCRLDPGTTTPEINRLLATCGSDLVAAKLLGAGGGGYVLLCAANAEAGSRIRQKLEQTPPNARARFIEFEIANSALEVTVS